MLALTIRPRLQDFFNQKFGLAIEIFVFLLDLCGISIIMQINEFIQCTLKNKNCEFLLLLKSLKFN